MFKRIVGIFIILMLVGVVVAQENITKPEPAEEWLKKDCPSEEACKLWEEFKAKYQSNYSWQVKWYGNRNSPHWIDGFYLLRRDIKNRDEAEAIAIDIITDSKDLLKIRDVSDLKLRRTMEDKWTFIPEYDQYYKGIPVYGGEVRVILNKNNVFSGITNTFYPDINISTTPTITREEAVEIVNEITSRNLIVDKNVDRLYILPKTEDGSLNYYLTWRIPTSDAIYFISAEDGSLLHRVQTAFPSEVRRGSGVGSISSVVSSTKSTYWVVAILLLISAFAVWRWRK